MCYMSPDKLTMMLSSRSNSIYEGKSPVSSHFLGSPGFIRQEESFIRNMGDNSECEPMNDSLLSIYNELDRDVHQRE